MGEFLALTGSESVFKVDSSFATTPLLQDLQANTIVMVQETNTNDQNGNVIACLLVISRQVNKMSNVAYYFPDMTVAAFATYLAGLSITTDLVQYNNYIQFNYSPVAGSPASILLNQSLIQNKAFNIGSQTTDFYVNYNNGETKILTFQGNLTLAAGGPVHATLNIPILASPVTNDTLLITNPDGSVMPDYTVPSGSPSQALVYAAIVALITANLTAEFTFTSSLNTGTNVATFIFTSPDPGSDFVGETISAAVTGTTFGSSPLTATFS